jgi:outer membrane protein assembly factor BamB
MQPSTSRRSFLALAATPAVSALAGCETRLGDADASFPDVDWPMVGRDPRNTAFVPDGTVPRNVEERWSQRLDDWPVTSPVVGGGSVFAASEKTVRAFDADDGTGRWVAELETAVLGTPGYDADGGVLYVTSFDRTTERRGAFLHAFDAASGARRWRRRVDDEAAYGVRIADGTVYVRTRSACVALSEGEPLWRYDDLSPVALPEYNLDDVFAGDVAPTVADDAVYVTTPGAVVALARETGEERWRAPLTDGYAAPAVRDGTVFAHGYTQTRAFDTAGNVVWSRDAGGVASPAVADDAVYVAEGDLVELDPATGEVRWSYDLRTDVVAATPVVLGDTVVAIGNRSATLSRDRPLFGLGSRERSQFPEDLADYLSPAVGAGGFFAVSPFPSDRLVAYR